MAEAETRSFLIQFMAETGDAVTAMNWLGRSMQKFPSLAVNAAAETEVAMAEMDTALQRAGESASDLSDVYTSMGRDSTEMIRAAGAASKIGIAGETNLLRFTAASRDFGFVTKTSADQASAALSELSIALGYETPEQVERLASGMTTLSRKTNVSAAELTNLLQQVGPLSNAIGVSESAVMGLSTSLAQTGLSAGQTIGPISKLMQMMQYSQLSGHALGQTMGLTGEAFDKFAEATPDKQVEMFMSQLGKMDKIPAEATLEGLGIASGFAATKMWEAAKKSENLTTYIGWANEAMKDNTALGNESAKIQKTLTYQLSELGKQLKAIYQMAGKALMPVLSFMVQALRGFLYVVMVIPKPILAVVAALSALGAALLTGAWLAKTKMVAGTMSLVAALWKEYAAVGGLTGLYKGLTSARIVAAASARAGKMGVPLRTGMLTGAFAKGAPKAVGAVGAGAGTTGMMAALGTAAAALGVSIAALLGIILAVIAAIVIMGIMIYKGVKMFREGEGSAKAFGAALLLLTGPIGAFVLGMMLLAKPIKRFKDEVVNALTPLYEMLVKFEPVLYAIGAVLLLTVLPALAPIAAMFAVIYLLMPLVVGMMEAFAEVLMWALEPFLPLAAELGALFKWIGEALGSTSDEGWGVWEVMQGLGKVLGYIVFGPLAALIKGIALIGELIVMLVSDIGSVGYALAWPFIWMWEKANEAFQWVADKFMWLVNKIMSPIEWIYNLWNTTMMKINSAIRWIIGPLKSVADAFWKIYTAVSGVSSALFGSSPWHIKESMEGEVIPALKETGKGFEGITDSAMGVHQVAKAKGGVVPKPKELSMAELEASKIGAAGTAVTSGLSAVGAAGPAEGPAEIKVSIPVTLTLDGMVIGKTMVEQLINLRERHMNPPGFPMRGVEPAF